MEDFGPADAACLCPRVMAQGRVQGVAVGDAFLFLGRDHVVAVERGRESAFAGVEHWQGRDATKVVVDHPRSGQAIGGVIGVGLFDSC